MLKLQAEQWNQLMTVQTSGASLYQEVISPFQSNPNVKIEIMVDKCTIKFTGEPTAVNCAYEHVLKHLNKVLHVTDRYECILISLLQYLPNHDFRII